MHELVIDRAIAITKESAMKTQIHVPLDGSPSLSRGLQHLRCLRQLRDLGLRVVDAWALERKNWFFAAVIEHDRSIDTEIGILEERLGVTGIRDLAAR